MDVTPKRRTKIITLSQHANKSQREIAKLCGVSQGTVSNILKIYKHTGSVSSLRKGRCGSKRKTTLRDDRFLLSQSRKDPRKTSDALRQDLETHGRIISARTVRHRLKEFNRPARKPVRKQLLTDCMKKKRFKWARDHRNWTLGQWRKVSFSDESHFEVQGQRSQFVRRSKNEPLRPAHIDQRVKHPDKQMYWGSFSYYGLGSLVPVSGMMNSLKYKDLLQTELPKMKAQFPDSDMVFQQDLAPCHVSKLMTRFFAESGLTVLAWPGNSPDLNPIENLWSIIKARLRNSDCTTKEKLNSAIRMLWNDDMELKGMCQKLADSMPKRVELLLKAKGGHIKY